MKKLLFILTLLWVLPSGADSVELITGGITYHLLSDPSVTSQFSNKLNSDGSLIANALYGVKYTSYNEIIYSSYTLFGGANSIGAPMGGAIYSYGVELDRLDVGFVGGGYFQDSSLFLARGIETTNFMPLLGVEVNYKIPLSEKTFIKINNLISVLVYNLSCSIGMNL
jgi:hypothetical protein